jgi:hypothetical protein
MYQAAEQTCSVIFHPLIRDHREHAPDLIFTGDPGLSVTDRQIILQEHKYANSQAITCGTYNKVMSST